MPSTQAIQATRPLSKAHKPTTLPGASSTKRSSTLTPAGFLFVFVTLFLALGAINGQNNLLFWLFGFSIAALIVSGLITGSALIAVRLTAHPIEPTEMGTPLTPRYTLHNTSRLLPNFALQIIELDAPAYSKRTPEHSIPAIALHIPPSSHTTVHSQITPAQRGLLTLSRIRIRTRFPFGLFTKTLDFTLPRQALILPRVLTIDRTHIDRLIASEDTSTLALNRRGTGLDYFALRQYQPGDPLRTIAWKQSARTGALLVTEYPEPATNQLALQLAPPTDTTDNDLFEHAVSLVYSILKSTPLHTRTALIIPWAHIAIPPNAGLAHKDRCARTLALLTRPEPGTHIHPQTITPSTRSNHRPITIGFDRATSAHTQDLYAEDYTTPNTTPAP